jgi:hypothetical protein
MPGLDLAGPDPGQCNRLAHYLIAAEWIVLKRVCAWPVRMGYTCQFGPVELGSRDADSAQHRADLTVFFYPQTQSPC